MFKHVFGKFKPMQCTEMRFASFLCGGFITAIAVNPPEWKLAKRTSVHCVDHIIRQKTRFGGIKTGTFLRKLFSHLQISIWEKYTDQEGHYNIIYLHFT